MTEQRIGSSRGVVPSDAGTRLKAFADDVLIADSRNIVQLHEGTRPPVLYVPMVDVKAALEPSDKATQCTVKGEASYYTIVLDDGRRLENAAWRYGNPLPGLEKIADCVAFDGNVVDRWVEGETD